MYIKTFLLLSTALILSSCNPGRNGKIIGLKETIHHDDFEYSVTEYITTGFINSESDTIKAGGVFYLVNFKVENRALRVNHIWDNSIGYIVDGKGNKFENNTYIQQFWNKANKSEFREEYKTPAGTSESVWLAFDLPADVRNPYLMVRGEFLMGDLFNLGKFRRTRIRLF